MAEQAPQPQPRTRGQRYVVAKTSDVQSGGRLLVDVAGREIALLNVDGVFYAVLNHCPHRGGALGMGNVVSLPTSSVPGEIQIDRDKKFLICPWHRWEFDLETGQSWCDAMDPGRRRYAVKPFDVQIAAGADLAQEDDNNTRGTEATVVDPERHRVKGPYQATMLPVEVDDEYVIVTMARRSPSSA
jgi:nitrite reductase/ring-hydroxylating ferredoxin subunit